MRATTVVIPCYNEEERLPVESLLRFASLQPEVGFLLVDDGSSDRTGEVIHGLASRCPEGIAALSLEQNRGKAEAVRQGLQRVFATGGVSISGYWDADLATPLESIIRLRTVLEGDTGLHLVMGSRVKLLGRHVHRSEVKHYLGRVFATAASVTLRLPVYDTQCGAKLIRVNAVTRAALATPFLSKWIFDVELLARLGQSLRADGRRVEDAVYEYPLEVWVDVAGSKVRPRDYLVAIRELWRIHRTYPFAKPERPVTSV